ncbi:MAG TPA: hypothetical protein VJ960_09740, partial [Oceanipulchritudo sp.]|nr:hypothetical protein [Oceanipulchritudo sp.]
MHFRIHYFLPALSLLMAFLPLAGQGPIELGDVVGRSDIEKRSVKVDGSPASLVTHASRLVDLHGGLERTRDGEDFLFRFEAGEEANVVRLSILSGGRVLWERPFEGSSQTDALYAATDAAVERTLGIPGFFRSKVAFISDRTGHAEVYLTDFLFQSVRQLTRDRSQCLSPELSPDGNRLLYTSYHGNGFPDIYQIDLRTGKRTIFAGFKGTNTGAGFSPDGRQVAMILSGSGNSEVYLSNAEGQQLRR